MAQDNEKTLRQMYSDMYRYMISKDTTSLGKMLDDRFVLVHMTGMRQPKHEYLRAIADGTLNYYTCTDSDIDIKIEGDTARMTGRSYVNAAVFGGGRHTWPLCLDTDLRLVYGQWLMTETRASTF
ncbi:MAG: nuclear transport factor 2 family protein [Bacteroides sp.]|nr:nuclear transport factor 2 family protein [Bacteroides sp.]